MSGGLDHPLVYLTILFAAMVEGEVTYVAASALVAQGRLHPLGVLVAGAIGAAMGDQLYFYLLRTRLTWIIARVPALGRRAEPLVAQVRKHDSAMVLAIRFAPGLRVAIAAACAYAQVPALKFSLLNGMSAFVWAALLMGLVTRIGPTYLAAIGLTGWKGSVAMGLFVVVLFRVFGRFEKRARGLSISVRR
jgi:membrane protein DedA with SNARE-associated domain